MRIYGYLEHPLYNRSLKVKYNRTCRCKHPLNELYENICFRCSRLLKIKSTFQERKCKHKHITSAGEIDKKYCPTDPYCLDCHQTVALFPSPVLWKDL